MGRLIRAISENGGVVFYALDSTDIVAQAERYHHTSAVATAALGRLLTGAAIMAATMKNEEDTLTLRLKGDGPAGVVLAVAGGDGTVKGYIENPVVELPLRPDGKLNVGAAVGHEGTLSVIRDIGLKEPYVGQIPLVSGEIAEDITSYYATSEQTPTVCALGVLVDTDLTVLSAGGYMVQLLPGATEEEITQLEQNISAMESVTQMLHSGLSLEDIMQRALAGFDPQVLDEQEVTYYCNCNRNRMERALMSLGEKELTELEKESPHAEVCCQFCDKKYEFNINQLRKALKEQAQERAKKAEQESETP
jgi:molecular chaperone Hsp33